MPDRIEIAIRLIHSIWKKHVRSVMCGEGAIKADGTTAMT